MTLSRTVDTTVRVRYAETDAQGVVYHANHVVFFEVGRGAFLRDHGLSYGEFEAAGHFIVVVEAHVRYHAPARYDDELVIRTWLKEVKNRSLTFEYEILKGETTVASGWTAHVCVDRQGKPVRLPDELMKPLGLG